MRKSIVGAGAFILSGCSMISTYSHTTVFPLAESVEMGTPKAYRSLELSGWYSGIPGEENRTVINETVETWSAYENTDTGMTLLQTTATNHYYLPKRMIGGSVGWNFSRYFGLGIHASIASGHSSPKIADISLDDRLDKWGYFLRAGGPIGAAEKVSLVCRIAGGAIAQSSVTTDSLGRLVTVGDGDNDMTATTFYDYYSSMTTGFQYRPIPQIGLSVGFGAQTQFMSMFGLSDLPVLPLQGIFYTGLSVMPRKDLAFSPWLGVTTFAGERDNSVVAGGVKVEFTPEFQ